jgi:hypothetical protein
MTRRKKIASGIETVALVLDCILLSVFVVLAIGVLVKTLQMDLPWRRLQLHRYLGLGFVSFFLVFLIPRLRKNVRWLMMFTHEFTHLVFAILFFRKIHRFNVDNKDSHVSFSNGWFGYMPITLSPYCIPLFTLALLPWRFTADQDVYLYVIDVLIGMTYAFHVCCWVRQIRLHQTDITGPGTFRSLLFITLFLVVGLCLVILTPSSGVKLALERVFWDFPRELILMVIR